MAEMFINIKWVTRSKSRKKGELSWWWSYGSWIYKYLCNKYLSH